MVAQVTADLVGDVSRQLGPGVEHGQDDALDVELGVQVVADEVEGGKQLGQSFQGVVLALQRDQNGVGGRQRVDGQQPERRRAIDEDVVVVGLDVGQQAAEASFAALDGRELDFRARERDRRWHDVEVIDRAGEGQFTKADAVDDRVVDRSFDGVTVETEATRGIALGVEVDDEDSLAEEGEVAPKIHDRRGLPDAALLVGTGDRLAHSVAFLDWSHDESILPSLTLLTSASTGSCDSVVRGAHLARIWRLSIARPFHVKRALLHVETRARLAASPFHVKHAETDACAESRRQRLPRKRRARSTKRRLPGSVARTWLTPFHVKQRACP